MNWDIVKFAIDHLLGWPVVALTFVLRFRRAIHDFLYRVRGFKAGNALGLDASTPEPTQIEARPETGLRSPEAQALLVASTNIGTSPSVLEREQLIRADLDRMQLDSTRAFDLLIRHLAFNQTLINNEIVYRTIFGTQIALLKHLNVQASTRSQIQTWYSEALKALRINFPTWDYSFDKWLTYLFSFRLINKTGDRQLTIATNGREFLKWMVAVGAPENKPF